MTISHAETAVTAFEGGQRLASGQLAYVIRAIRSLGQAGFPVLVLDDATGRTVDVDLRGSEDEVLERLPAAAARGPGRPKLGVMPREVTLLPRHWDWLAAQPGGASVTLRKVVEEAMRSPAAAVRAAQEVVYRAMTTLAGNQPGYEEATRALFAADEGRFNQHTERWPADIRDYARRLAGPVFPVV